MTEVCNSIAAGSHLNLCSMTAMSENVQVCGVNNLPGNGLILSAIISYKHLLRRWEEEHSLCEGMSGSRTHSMFHQEEI